jgi:hypothetical protein
MYLVQKLYKHTFLKYALKKFKIAAGLYLLKNGNEKYTDILIDVSNSTYSHLGDQLFYQPLLHHLLQRNVSVKIAPSRAMMDYFRFLYGQKVVVSNAGGHHKQSLVIMPFWAYDPNQNDKNADLLLVDFTDPGIELYISGWLVSKISNLLGLDQIDDFDIGAAPYTKLADYEIKECLPVSEDVVIFNNYIDSGKFRVNGSHQRSLSGCITKFKEKGYTVVHVGSGADLANDPREYDFVDVDVRGKIAPLDLISYFYRPNVRYSVTFDNFVMHASVMANKMSYVKFRGRYTHSAREHHYKHVNQAFKTVAGKNLITYI